MKNGVYSLIFKNYIKKGLPTWISILEKKNKPNLNTKLSQHSILSINSPLFNRLENSLKYRSTNISYHWQWSVGRGKTPSNQTFCVVLRCSTVADILTKFQKSANFPTSVRLFCFVGKRPINIRIIIWEWLPKQKFISIKDMEMKASSNILTLMGISAITRPLFSSMLLRVTTSPPTTMLIKIPSA